MKYHQTLRTLEDKSGERLRIIGSIIIALCFMVLTALLGCSSAPQSSGKSTASSDNKGAEKIKKHITVASEFAELVKLAKKLDPPQINSIPILTAMSPSERDGQVKGFRFMGQRFTVDASIFQRLVASEVPGRGLPKGLDIPAAMGSDEALELLDTMGETKYEKYSENMAKMKKHIAGLGQKTWTQNLYWGWLYSLLPLTEEKPEGYPIFMRNEAWARKQLNTYLGSWTELKHDTILYAKQVYEIFVVVPIDGKPRIAKGGRTRIMSSRGRCLAVQPTQSGGRC